MAQNYKRILWVDLVALGCFILAPIITEHPKGQVEQGFFAQPLPAVVMLLACGLFIGAGIAALRILLDHPLSTRYGRWAWRIALFFAWILVAGVSLAAGVHASGHEISEEVGQWLELLILLLAVSAGTLGWIAKEEGCRGILVVPLILGVFQLNLLVGELVIQG